MTPHVLTPAPVPPTLQVPPASTPAAAPAAPPRRGHSSPTVAVLGLGYVGLPTSLAATAAGLDVLGIDISEDRLRHIRGGEVDLLERDHARLTDALSSGALRMTANTRALSRADVPKHPRSTFFDYVALSQVVDHMFVMAWGIHWATSAPGAQDDLPWVTKVTAYIATLPNVGRYVMGTQLYAMDWASGGGSAHPATSYEYADAMALAGSVAAAQHLDAVSDGMSFAFTAPNGAPHAVWFADASTVGRRFALAAGRGMGFGVWRLGQEDQRIWEDPLVLAP